MKGRKKSAPRLWMDSSETPRTNIALPGGIIPEVNRTPV